MKLFGFDITKSATADNRGGAFSAKRQSAAPAFRSFDGATGGRRGVSMGRMGAINPEVAAAAPQLRTRARYLAANNPWLANAVANYAAALTGPGIVATSRAKSKTRRRSLARQWEAFIRQADADGRTDFNGMQAAVARGLIIDGEAFLQIIDGPDALPQLRLIPPELVDESMTRPLANGGYIVAGIEFNSIGQRDAYHVFPSRPTDLFQTYAAPIRIPADDILHVMQPLAAGQVRGVSWLAPIILRASELDQLSDALLVGVKIAAMFAAFITDQNSVGANNDPIADLPETGLTPGAMMRLPAGLDVKFSTPQQAAETGAFVKHQLRQLAAGLGVPSHFLDGDLTGANYSSLRAGLLPFRQRVEQTQYLTLVPQLLNPVWRAVFLDDADGADWLPPRPLQVDPLKDTEATVAEIEAGLTSRRKAVAERGWAIEDLDAEIAADTFTPRSAKPATPPKQQKVADDDL